MEPKNYLKYSGMAIQMGITILLGVLAGQYLDKIVGTSTPWFTIGLSLFATLAAVYLTVNDLLKP